MGGEYLPNRQATEVEIARINIDSTTSDVTSVYAKVGKNRIYYRLASDRVIDLWAALRDVAATHHAELDALATAYLGHRNKLDLHWYLQMSKLPYEVAPSNHRTNLVVPRCIHG